MPSMATDPARGGRDMVRHAPQDPERLEARLRALEERERALDERLRCIAHDLASPLVPMRLQVELWKGSGIDTKELMLMERSIERMTNLVRDVSDLTLPGHGPLRVERQRVDLSLVAREAVDAARRQADDLGITLLFRTRGPVWAHADRLRVAQVVDNLLCNALKFTSAGGVVTVTARRTDGHVHLAVTDTGRGLSKEDRSLLFQPFSQVHWKGDRRQGSGLGLFICKSIVDAHDGTIHAESPGRGHGSRFVVRLPNDPPGHRRRGRGD